MTELTKLPRTQLRDWAYRHCMENQGGCCPITNRPIDFTKTGATDWVVDHDHQTGEIRGVLSRGANGMEGKVFNAVARWAGAGNNPAKVIRILKNLIAYWEQPGTGLMYPGHKTDEEKRLARNAKARKQRAEAKARAALRGK